MKAIILAAGFGTRLYPLTEHVPKALLKVGSKTVLDHLVEKLDGIEQVDEIILVSNGKFYIDFFQWRKKRRYKTPIQIIENKAFVPEFAEGAVRDLNLALRSGFCGSDDALVLCADNYFSFSFTHFLLPVLGHRESVFMGVHDVEDKKVASECGVVLTDEHHRITAFEEKPRKPKSTKVSVGIYYLPRAYRLRVHEYLEIEAQNPDKIGSFFEWLTQKEDGEPLYAVELFGKWYDIGTPASYDAVRRSADAEMVAA